MGCKSSKERKDNQVRQAPTSIAITQPTEGHIETPRGNPENQPTIILIPATPASVIVAPSSKAAEAGQPALADTISQSSLDQAFVNSVMNASLLNSISDRIDPLTSTPVHSKRRTGLAVDSQTGFDSQMLTNAMIDPLLASNLELTPSSRSHSKIWTDNDEDTLKDTSKNEILLSRLQKFSLQLQTAKATQKDFALCAVCKTLEHLLPAATPKTLARRLQSTLGNTAIPAGPSNTSPGPNTAIPAGPSNTSPGPSTSPNSANLMSPLGKPPLPPSKREKSKEENPNETYLFTIIEKNGTRLCSLCGDTKIADGPVDKRKQMPEVSLHELEYGRELSNRWVLAHTQIAHYY
jgi:hypothetical protein